MPEERERTTRKAEKRHQKEARELARLEKHRVKPKAHGYLYYMMFIICIIYIADEITSQIGTQMQSVLSQALFLFPVGSATLQLMQGFLADKWGRKPAAITMSACVIISYLLFFIGSNHDWPPYLVGFLYGAAVGSYWAAGDIIGAIMVSESAPTNLRSSVLTAFAICSTIFGGIGVIAGLVLLNLLGDSMVGYITLGIALPGLTIALILLCTKTHDTKNVDIGAVTGTEWD